MSSAQTTKIFQHHYLSHNQVCLVAIISVPIDKMDGDKCIISIRTVQAILYQWFLTFMN